MGHVTCLHHRGVLEIGGEDRLAFLQGLISNDVAKAGPGRGMWAGLLTPQGKFLFDLFLTEGEGTLLVDAEAERLEELRKKLSMYKLRAKVSLAPRPDLRVFAAWGEVGPVDGVAFADPRLPALGLRLLRPSAPAGLTEAPFAAWDELRIRLGVPDGSRDLPVEKALLLENGFDELGGVDFKKGCYMGQELTSRTKHRGLVRKRLMPVEIDGPIPEAGTPVMVGEAEAGEMRSSCGSVGLALIRLELFRQGGPFICGEARLRPSQPEWAVFPQTE